jgi:hypothetical protein
MERLDVIGLSRKQYNTDFEEDETPVDLKEEN